MTKSKGINRPKHQWTQADIDLLTQRYPHEPAQRLADSTGASLSSIYKKANSLGLKKSPQFWESDMAGRIQRAKQLPSMIATRFQTGLTPWNKGMKGLQFEGSKPTQFKPGQKPHTWVPVGSYRITADGALEQKVNDLPGPNNVRWKAVARLVWQATHGPVPSGHIVVFKRGRQTTVLEQITLDAIECISRAENAWRNHPNSISPELGRLVQLRGAITRQINKRTRQQTEGVPA